MDKPKQAEVVTIQGAIEKVRKWLKEKDYKKAKQGCEEILAVEKDNAEVQKLLEEAKKGLGENTSEKQKPKSDMPTPTPIKASSAKPDSTKEKVENIMPEKKAPQQAEESKKATVPTPESIMKNKEPAKTEKTSSVEKKDQSDHPKAPAKNSSPLGKIILLIILLVLVLGLVFAFLQGWLNPAFDWLLNLFGL